MTRKSVGMMARATAMAAVPVAMLAASAPLSAQRGAGRTLFEWRGRVDQEVRIQMHGGRTAIMAMGPRESVGYDNARSLSSVPDMNGYVTVRMMEGRGVADVVQQPNRSNGYTTVIRIRDRQSGVGRYDVEAYWEPYGNSRYIPGAYPGGYNDRHYDPRRYDVSGRYDVYGSYDAYGRYAPYPPVPVQRPVYVNQGAGKTLPGTVPARPEVSPPRVIRPVQNGSAGKTLPGTARPTYPGDDHGRW